MPTFTKLYLTNDTAPFDPAATKGAWTATTGAVVRKVDSQKNDLGAATTTVAVADTVTTNPNKRLLYQGISGPLAAQTISGTINLVIPILESSASANMNWGLHVWVTQGDSNTVRGTLLTDYSEAAGTNEWPTTATATALNAAQTMTNVICSAGDRIVVEIGYYARNAVSTSFTGTLRYGVCDATTLLAFASDLTAGDTGASLTTKAPYVLFGSAITEGTVNARLSQLSRETFIDTNPTAQLSQLSREVFIALNPNAQVSQVVREVFISGWAVQTGWGQLLSHKRNRMIS